MINSENTSVIDEKKRKPKGKGFRISHFWLKLRNQIKKKNIFLLSLVITYLLTVILTIGISSIQMDQERDKNDNESGLSFYECSNLDTVQFVTAKIMEALIPTTITFCATILLLQTDVTENKTLTVWLFVFIFSLIVVGIVLPTIKTYENLMKAPWIICILCIITLILSWRAFSDPPTKLPGHKNEPSDGKTVF